MIEVLTVISQIKASNQTLSVMGIDDTATHLHINDFKTNKNSTMTPIADIQKALKGVVSND